MKTIDITRIENEQRQNIKDFVIREVSLKLEIDSEDSFILPCSGRYVSEMITGFLYTNGYINTIGDITSLDYNVETQTASIGIDKSQQSQNGLKWQDDLKLPASKILDLMEEFSKLSEQFKKTGAVHTAAIATQRGIKKYFDDISRHNAIDMIIGYGMTNNEPFRDKCLLLTCRISRSIMSKVMKAGFPMVVSTSPPTDQALKIARENNIAMAGFVKGSRMNIYHNKAHFL